MPSCGCHSLPCPDFLFSAPPHGLDSSPWSLPPGLLRVCAGGPDWTLARLRLTFTILDLERWHILVLQPQEGEEACRRKGKAWHKCEFNSLWNLFSHMIWALWLHSTSWSVQVPASLFLCLQVSFRFVHHYSISTVALILLHKTSLLLELVLWNKPLPSSFSV